ncbi:MAG: hypothetical protein ACHQNT_05335 [Bacteroidia bacterium]
MATSICELLKSAGLNSNRLRTIHWGEPIDNSSVGIYIVSTSSKPDANSNHFAAAPIDENKLRIWINKVKTICIDGSPNPTVAELKQRLNRFWLPDESIIYIGQTECSGGLKRRMLQYYKTELGDTKPHAGGHWIKTLKNLNQLFVHYISTMNPEQTEAKLMQNFVAQVSDSTRKKIGTHVLPLPFANLELEKWKRKNHGITFS